MDCNKPTTPPPTPFQTIELRGGPFDGQAMRVPIDEDTLELSYGGRTHTYRRFNSARVMRHDDVLAKMGGGK